MDFVFDLPKDVHGNTGIVVFVDQLRKMAHLAAVPDSIEDIGTAQLSIDRAFRRHGLPVAIVSYRDTRFTSKFSKSIFQVLGTRLDMSTTPDVARFRTARVAVEWCCRRRQRIIRRLMVKQNALISL